MQDGRWSCLEPIGVIERVRLKLVHKRAMKGHVKVVMGHATFFLGKVRQQALIFLVICLILLCNAYCFKTKLAKVRTHPNRNSLFLAFSVVAQTLQNFNFS